MIVIAPVTISWLCHWFKWMINTLRGQYNIRLLSHDFSTRYVFNEWETFDYQREHFWLFVGIFWLKTVCNITLPFFTALSEPEASERRVRWWHTRSFMLWIEWCENTLFVQCLTFCRTFFIFNLKYTRTDACVIS